MTISVAQNLQKCGFEKGDVVAIMAPDVPGLAPIVFGCICMGLPIMNMNGTSNLIFKITKPKLLFCLCKDYDEIVDALAKLQLKIKIYTFGGTKGESEAAESFLKETGIKDDFS